jgi:hypothetical protein
LTIKPENNKNEFSVPLGITSDSNGEIIYVSDMSKMFAFSAYGKKKKKFSVNFIWKGDLIKAEKFPGTESPFQNIYSTWVQYNPYKNSLKSFMPFSPTQLEQVFTKGIKKNNFSIFFLKNNFFYF